MNLGIYMMLIGIVALLVSVVLQLAAIKENQVALGKLLNSIRKQVKESSEETKKNGNTACVHCSDTCTSGRTTVNDNQSAE